MHSLLIVYSSEEFYGFDLDVAFCAVEYKTIFLCNIHQAQQISIMLLFIFSEHHNVIKDIDNSGVFFKYFLFFLKILSFRWMGHFLGACVTGVIVGSRTMWY